jgi:recombinational DNA repair protein RecT
LGGWGIEPDGRRAHLIPFYHKDRGYECTLIIDYRGISEVLRRNGDVSAIHCDVVGENDQFEIRFGTRGILDHVPNVRDRGRIYCAYSWVKLPNGMEEFDVMGVEEIEKIRRRSKTPDDGPWKTDYAEMAKKTVFRRHSKMLPLSPHTREVLDRDNDGDSLTEQERFQAATPVKASVLDQMPRRRGRPAKLETDFGQQQLPPEDENPETPQTPSEPRESVSAAIAPEGAQNAPDELPGMPEVPLHEQVSEKLRAAGFSEAELITMLKKKRSITTEDAPHTNTLDQVKPRGLLMCLDQWENAQILHLEQRAGKL